MRKIILASHGSMAEGVLSAAKMIMGDCEEIQALGLDHYESPTEIARRIERQVTAEPDCDFMIFCDIHGGSVHNQLTELCRYPNVDDPGMPSERSGHLHDGTVGKRRAVGQGHDHRVVAQAGGGTN